MSGDHFHTVENNYRKKKEIMKTRLLMAIITTILVKSLYLKDCSYKLIFVKRKLN